MQTAGAEMERTETSAEPQEFHGLANLPYTDLEAHICPCYFEESGAREAEGGGFRNKILFQRLQTYS